MAEKSDDDERKISSRAGKKERSKNHSIKIEGVLWAEIGKLQEAPIIHRLSMVEQKNRKRIW